VNPLELRFEEALERIAKAALPGGVEELPLSRALGRIPAFDLRSLVDCPSVPVSRMDGWALRSLDLSAASDASPVLLRIEGASYAGDEPSAILLAGTCRRVTTGAPLPAGADAVVREEDVVTGGAGVGLPGVSHAAFRFPTRPGSHVRTIGAELGRGQLLLGDGAGPADGPRPGRPLDPGDIGLLAAGGHAVVSLFEPPPVAILAVGSELKAAGDPLDPGQIHSSNLRYLEAACLRDGCRVVLSVTVPDDRSAIEESVRRALQAGARVIVTAGGARGSERDLVGAGLDQLGWTPVFTRLRVHPGPGTSFGTLGSSLVFVLPGTPSACLLVAEIFVRPALRRIAGWSEPGPWIHKMAALGVLPEAAPDMVRLAPGRIEGITVRLLPGRSLVDLARTDAIILGRREEGAGGTADGRFSVVLIATRP
jgi:molybdenum cofactor synthesis domain-containing protein